jgi:hypothetical protein
MFQYGQLSNALFYVQHQHSDGSWGTMVPEPEPDPEHEPHDPAQLDPEQEWQRGHVYVCQSCEERVRIMVPQEQRPNG